MNPMATSKEEILKTSRVLIQQNGWKAVNIRAVAAACGVSVGCIYNYFGSKTELVSAAVESIWSDIFRHPDDPAVFEDTLSCIRWMYRQLEYGSAQYPGFFTHHALGFVRQDTADGKQQMRQTWQHILDAPAGCCHCTDVDRFPSILLDEDPARFQDLLLGRCHRIRMTTSST